MENTGLPTHRRYEQERRVAARVEVIATARLVHDDGVLEGEIENLSSSGASFSTRDTEPELTAGARVVLRSTVKATDRERLLERRGAIVRSEDFFDGEHDVMTYAVAFDEALEDTFFED